MSQRPFRVGVARQLMPPGGTLGLAELGLEGLATTPGIEWAVLPEAPTIADPELLDGFDAIVLEQMHIRASSLEGIDRLVLVARYGVGFDSVDIDACTERGVLVTNTPDGVQRPMAAVNLALLLAVTLRLVQKDRMTRDGRWNEAGLVLGIGLTNRTLGLVGMGNIGSETLLLARPLGMRHLVHDPFLDPSRIRAAGAEPAGLDELLRELDVVILGVPLTSATHHLMGARELALMRPTACLVNTTRGPVVDEAALIGALRSGRLAGAALDVFETEPVEADNPLLALDNVIVTPHALGSTDECFALIGQSVTSAILDVVHGRPPRFVVNRPVLAHPRLAGRLRAGA